jgi:hypothetical protein
LGDLGFRVDVGILDSDVGWAMSETYISNLQRMAEALRKLTQPRRSQAMNCKNCGLPIKELLDPWGGKHGWYHPTIEREVNIDGADVMTPATFCPLGEAEPVPVDRHGEAREAYLQTMSGCDGE